ncbi:uncharacterized protein LDX57_000794 [Aspergillus melleus]|uniref:uncharacterized protein n=1 Tax=Aspergillus melleus TaxID=138277 RepID=UPI001E8E8BB1|nr:Transcription factor rbf1 (RPG-box-binding factor) (Repressor-activator protein 1) [Aspergillus melleus]KAH8423038.1 Transcription factor rbf1 (RPG-box-binding factor) (Repressor-activator protein 1) [Aspergillus melleus]
MPHLRWLPSMLSRSSAATAPHTGLGQGSHAGHAGHTTLPTLSSGLRMGTPNTTPQQHLPQQSPVHHPQAQIHPHAHAHANTHAHTHPHSHSHQHSHSHSHSQPPPHSQGRHTGGSVVVEGRRGQQTQPQHRQHQQHPQHPQQAESMESSDSEQSDGGHREGRGGSGPDGSEEVEYMPSPGENTPSRRAGGRGRADDGHGSNHHGADGRSAMNPVIIDHSMGDEVGNAGGDGAGADADGANDNSRKHGKRLTTKEEVSLFDICNRHAEEFGQRSNLCNWWRTVTAEFTSEQGHPYSWHSVRRKVEIVTKQRMKFLEDQREKGGSEADDMSNPRWRASVDAWIPTWQRWEDAEARRIEKRDSRRPRKRKDRSWESSGGWEEGPTNSSDGGWRATSSPLVNQSSSFLPPSATQSPQVRLPPGFDNMFNSPVVGGTSPATKAAGPSSTMGNTSMPDNNMMSAMLETLGKLNKHLDTVNTDQQNASPLASSLAGSNQRDQNPRRDSQQDSDGEDSEPTGLSAAAISKFKEELRQEMRQEIRNELEKDRAAFEDRLDSVQRTQDMILEMLRQEPV